MVRILGRCKALAWKTRSRGISEQKVLDGPTTPLIQKKVKITAISQKFQYHTANKGSNQGEFKAKLLSMDVSNNMDRSAYIRSIA